MRANLFQRYESDFKAAARARDAVRTTEVHLKRLKAADENSYHTGGDSYLNQPGLVSAVYDTAAIGYAQFDPSNGEVNKAKMTAQSYRLLSPATQMTVSGRPESQNYTVSQNYGLTSMSVTIDKTTGRYTLEDKVMGVTVSTREFGDLSQPRWTEEWPQPTSSN